MFLSSNAKSSERTVNQIFKILNSHEKFLNSSLPMIASENITSFTVRSVMFSDLQHRYAEGKPGERVYSGCEYIDMVELEAVELAKRLFKAEHANVQPTSGSVANFSVYACLTNPGDTIASLSVRDGGHITMNRVGLAGKLGLNVLNLPFDKNEMNIDVDGAVKLIRKEKPKLVMLGASVMLFPHPVKEIAEVCREVNSRLVYDASHVLGLIAGKQFQNPLEEGALVVTASTHKTFPGPQRAVIFGNPEEDAEKLDYSVMPCCVSNHHLHSLSAYAVACMEMLEFGESYAKQTVRNARALAESLASHGFNVFGEERGYTESHQVVFEGGAEEQNVLEKNGIFVNVWPSTRMIRAGVQEVTRLGMKEGEMEYIAELMARALRGEDVRNEVRELSSGFNVVHYSFDSSLGSHLSAHDPSIFDF